VRRLAPPAKLDQWTERPEANRHGGEHTQQRRLHQRAPMRDAMLSAHPHQSLDQSKPHQRAGIAQENCILISRVGGVSHQPPEVPRDAEARHFGHGANGKGQQDFQGAGVEQALHREAPLRRGWKRHDQANRSQTRAGLARHQKTVDSVRVEFVGFDSFGIVQRCFQRVLDAIDLVANPLGLHDAFGRVGGKHLKMQIEALQQRISARITDGRRDRERAAAKRMWCHVIHSFPLR
jgi:hypothetical protein